MADSIESSRKKERYFMLDVIRIVCALAIFGRHSITMAGFSYGDTLNNLFLNTTSIIMTCFFILSGFSLYLSNGKRQLFQEKNLSMFYKKRAISILPIYYLVHLAWLIFVEDDISKGLLYLPSELLGIQTIFSSTFNVAPNGATWFISCLIISYFFYPLIQELIHKISLRARIILLVFLLALDLYLPIYGLSSDSISLYTNPLFRLIEFTIGIVLASVNAGMHDKRKPGRRDIMAIAIVAICVLILFIGFDKGILFIMNPAVVFVCIAIFYSVQIRCEFLESCRPLIYISGLTYGFYILQIFIWSPSHKIIDYLGISGQKFDFLIAVILLIIVCIAVNELYEKPLKKLFRTGFMKKGYKQ